MKRNKMVFLLLCFFVMRNSAEAQDMFTVHPSPYKGALSNPLKGFRPDLLNATSTNNPNTTIVRHYIKWNEVENSASDDFTKLVDYANNHWSHLPGLNIRVIPRIYVDWDNRSGNEYWPADILQQTGLQPDDPQLWKTQIVKDRLVKLIAKMGQAWNDDPRIAWLQTGLVGYWGEQENPVGVDEENYVNLLGEAFSKAFPNKMLVVRNQKYWDAEGYKWGAYWDSYGHPGQTNGAWADLQRTTTQERYLNEIVEGEVAYNWGENVFDPVYGGEPTVTLGNNQYTENMIDVIRDLHCTGLGWIADYKIDGRNGTDPDIVMANAAKMQKEFGYRFILSEFSCSSQTISDRTLDLNFRVKNVGSAPFYHSWPIAVVLIDETTKEVVWKSTLTGIDPSIWKPGSAYDYEAQSYQNPAPEYTYSAQVEVPDSISDGKYMIGLTILEPYSQSPGIFFAIDNFIGSSQTQPLMRVGIGIDITDGHKLNMDFDDPVLDDARYYTVVPNGTVFKLATEVSITNPTQETVDLNPGKVEPASGNFPENTTVTVQAVEKCGFDFAGWEGDLSGMANPQTLVINSDKTITANFTFTGIPDNMDMIHGITAPDDVKAGEEVFINVAYEASEVRDIRVFIQLNTDPWSTYGSSTTTVSQGIRSEDFKFTVSQDIPILMDAYKIVVNLLPVGGGWSDRLDEKIITDVDALSSEVSPTALSIDNCPSSALAIGEKYPLEYSIVPGDASNKSVVWYSSSSSIVSVDENGLLTALKAGKVRIFAVTVDGDIKNYCEVSAEEPLGVIASSEEHFTTFPNPVENLLTLEFEDNSNRTINIFNLTGRLLYHDVSVSQFSTIDLKKIIKSNACLLLQVVSKSSVSTKKIVVN